MDAGRHEPRAVAIELVARGEALSFGGLVPVTRNFLNEDRVALVGQMARQILDLRDHRPLARVPGPLELVEGRLRETIHPECERRVSVRAQDDLGVRQGNLEEVILIVRSLSSSEQEFA